MENREEKIACLSLLTREMHEDTPVAPLTRAMYYEIACAGARESLVLRDTAALGDGPLLDRARLLLGGCARAGRLLEQLESQGYEMILPDDALWPRSLFSLGRGMPPFLLLRGNTNLLRLRKAAVAGSRDILPLTHELAGQTGKKLLRDGFAMVCGGARGVDDAAQRAILDGGGSLILVPAIPVDTLLTRHRYLKDALDDGRLLIVCDSLPHEPFSAAKALLRNHTIYSLGEVAIVVAARERVGGSWRGARDCLRLGATPLFVLRQENGDMAGNAALLALGARELDWRQRLDMQIAACRGGEQLDLFEKRDAEEM